MSTFEATLHQLPEPILNKLRAMISRVRRLLFIRGLFATLAVALTCVLIIMAIDATMTLYSGTVRWTLSLIGLGLTAAAAWWFLIRPLSRKFTLTQIARILEIRHPELQERISTAVELMASEDPDSIRGSEELIEAVVDSAVVDVQQVDPKSEFSAGRASRFVTATGVALTIIALLMAIWPKQSWILLSRAVAPFLNIGNAWADTLVVEPGDIRIAIGESVTVKLSVQHHRLRQAQIRRTLADESESVERMTLVRMEDDGTREFEITFPNVQESFDYRVRAGSAVSEYFRVEAVPQPAVQNLTLRYDYPSYTQRPPEEFATDTGEIKALAHTRVTVRAELNKPVTESELRINEHPQETETTVDGNTVSWSFELNPTITGGNWKLALTDADGLENEPIEYPIEAIPDQSPKITVTDPEARQLKLKPTELLPLKFQVAEDYGFSQVDLLVTPSGEPNPRELIQPTPESDGQPGVWRGVAPLNITALDLEKHQNRLTVQLRARDNMPAEYEGPNEGVSEKIIIVLDRNAPSLAAQTMKSQREEIQEAIDETQRELEQAKAEAKEAERQLAREETVSQDTMQDLEEFREKTNTAQETLREVAEKMEETVFNQQAEELENVAEDEVAKAREAADMIPVTDEKEERVAEAKEAREQVEQALEDLKDIEKSLQDANEEMEMIAELNDLANEQRRIAQEAEQRAEENSEQQEQLANADPQQQQRMEQQQQQQMNQFQQEQNRVQQELGEMLRENPEALREILEQQQEQAEQLAQEAQEMAQEQEQLREMTQEAAGEQEQQALQDQLVAQLQEMQQQVARDTQELQNELNEQQQNAGEPLENASEQTQEASESLQQEDNLAEAADAAQEASEALAQAQEQSEAAAENPEMAQAGEPEPGEPQPGEPQEGEPQQGEPQPGEPAAPEMAQAQPGEPQPGEPQAGEPQPGEPQPGEPQNAQPENGEPAAPEMAQAQPGEPQPGEPQPGEPQPGEPQPGEPQAGEPQPGEPQPGEPQPGEPAAPEMAQAGEPQAGEPQPGEPQAGEPQSGQPQTGEPQSSPLAAEETQQQLAELAETQEMIAQQLEAIEAGQLEDALAMMEQALGEQSESLQAQAEALEQATQAAGQRSAQARADQAENALEQAMRQTDQAEQQLAQAQQAQDAAEQAGQTPEGQTAPQAQQAMNRSQGTQQQAQNSMNQASRALEQTAEALAQAIEGIDPGEMQEELVQGEDLAESFEDVSDAAQSENAQDAAQQSQQAAQSLQELAQQAMEQMGSMGQQSQQPPQPGQEGQPQPQPGEFVEGSQELNESGMKNADINGDGVPPELAALGISVEDWSRLKGNLQSGSASQNGDALPAEYRDLVSRYFQVIAKEAGKNK